jgi:hypothetical protein
MPALSKDAAKYGSEASAAALLLRHPLLKKKQIVVAITLS